MCFTSNADMKFALQGWSINNVQYIVIASNTKKYTVACAKHDCQYQHSCATPILNSGHRQCNSQFISFYILPTIRKQMDLKPKEIIGCMEAKFNIKVPYIKAWDARRKAIKTVFGSWEESKHLCVISDLHAVLVRGCRKIFPGAAHRHYLRHLCENFKKAIRQMGLGDVEFLCQKIYAAENSDDICASLKRVEEESRRMPEPIRLNMHEFQVLDMSSRSYRVDLLDGRTCMCSCGKPLLYHIPCAHVVCCVAMLRRSHLDFILSYYSMTNYKLTYSAEFHHIPNKEEWVEHDLTLDRNPFLSPNYIRRSGRPRTARYRNTIDES
ncbi:hypothetical protein M5K25_023271 [Dendrobium thyrsiflorum]|uniref:SWIM-type domain-containing protein n=1 Tax=Dendrobium thyrsiflorum TaxID=117978 RepID=A0ABD0U7N1_DENTH